MVNIASGKKVCWSGYTYNQDRYDAALIQTISDVLKDKQARHIPCYIPTDGAPVINYEILVRDGLSLSTCPANTRFLNKPPTFLGHYQYFILGTSFLYFAYYTALPVSYSQLECIEESTTERDRCNGYL